MHSYQGDVKLKDGWVQRYTSMKSGCCNFGAINLRYLLHGFYHQWKKIFWRKFTQGKIYYDSSVRYNCIILQKLMDIVLEFSIKQRHAYFHRRSIVRKIVYKTGLILCTCLQDHSNIVHCVYGFLSFYNAGI